MTKRLEELAALLPGARIVGDAQTEITSIERDSRRAREGTLFACIVGAHIDAHSFIPDVARAGARAVLTERASVDVPAGVAVLYVLNLEKALDTIVPFFYDYPARVMRVVGITGTNGKTTTSYLVRAILRHAGHRVGLIGTIQAMIEDEVLPTSNTTPDIIVLQQMLAEMRTRGMDTVVMEVSSHALALGRVAGIEFDTAVFTNLTQDHLDFHKTMENYARAKAHLFELVSAPGAKEGKTAVLNADDAASETMRAYTRCPIITYGVDHPADLTAQDVQLACDGMELTLMHGGKRLFHLHTGITGLFNVHNVLAAVGASLAEQVAATDIAAALTAFTGVPGRFELVREGQDFAVIVDYAHTPDGMENVLRTARAVTKGHIIAVFGCGGDRDRTKRPIMGRIGAEMADIAILTSDNPRTEDPTAIVDEVERGVLPVIGDKPYEKIVDRRTAIFHAIGRAQAGDTVVILGKGHETYQILKDGTIHFDDREQAREAIRSRA
ncbi:UDP-N-acetylmuramoyl-L-alanyl-D-glutamate--2,6-diaminopimelate ligase [Selenomonas sp. oral taxon 149]|uniref:UDP-N-acetylmuramoyl-L-alanyl-D-glutamate--2, 6-diaminopimelate ligase n=1 Tax=Selenomonas sp. oral taxon 149 TaxID=712535 RepID=UPI0001E0A7B5|nr:UDP-N-acetylmuramoyl-L-alanyl-D-glutamate--2,6-diaminopimelate ligase [Selenomonas sp. oral taxon 149]EFM23251.1 UDP-N-acetylmuramoyl-L-alanyl-D-glutamate--2,6-diaminopimelate ligase [Selenomonas sp. oral taxon 149 str. 67H29BP]